MSLINNMLKDLENREAPRHALPPMALTSSTVSKHVSRNTLFISAALFSSLIVLFAVLYFTTRTSTIHTALPSAATHPSASATPSTDASWLKSTSINGVTVQIKGSVTELTFLLDHPALYRIGSLTDQHQLSLVIERAQLQTELPPVNYLNTAIDSISEKNINGDANFTLALSSGATIKYINLSNNENNPELTVAIDNPVVANETATSQRVEKAVKLPAMQNMLSQQYQSALSAAENGQYQDAIQHLTSLLKINPAFKDARASLAALLIDQGSALRAKHVIEEGLNESPEYVPFIELKARILATEGKTKQALSILRSSSPPLMENPDYHAFIAAMYQQNNEHALAIKLYTKLLELNPHNANWWFGLGVSLDKNGQDHGAIDAYTKSAAEGHLSPESFAYLENRLHKLQEAVDDK